MQQQQQTNKQQIGHHRLEFIGKIVEMAFVLHFLGMKDHQKYPTEQCDWIYGWEKNVHCLILILLLLRFKCIHRMTFKY